MYKTSKENPPPFDGVEYWERCLDPSHPNAFSNVMSVLDRCYQFGIINTLFSKRKAGWLGINRENPEAWYPDGSVIEGNLPIENIDFVIGILEKYRAFRNEEQMIKFMYKRYPKL